MEMKKGGGGEGQEGKGKEGKPLHKSVWKKIQRYSFF